MLRGARHVLVFQHAPYSFGMMMRCTSELLHQMNQLACGLPQLLCCILRLLVYLCCPAQPGFPELNPAEATKQMSDWSPGTTELLLNTALTSAQTSGRSITAS